MSRIGHSTVITASEGVAGKWIDDPREYRATRLVDAGTLGAHWNTGQVQDSDSYPTVRTGQPTHGPWITPRRVSNLILGPVIEYTTSTFGQDGRYWTALGALLAYIRQHGCSSPILAPDSTLLQRLSRGFGHLTSRP